MSWTDEVLSEHHGIPFKDGAAVHEKSDEPVVVSDVYHRIVNRRLVFQDIGKERARQDAKWGWDPDDGTSIMSGPNIHAKVSVLLEEVGEVAHAVLEGDDANLEDELIQVAAVAVAWLESRSEYGR